MARNEHFNFDTSTYAICNLTGTMVADTTPAQELAVANFSLMSPVATSFFVEPAHGRAQGQQAQLDDLSRIFLMVSRDPTIGGASPAGYLSFYREGDEANAYTFDVGNVISATRGVAFSERLPKNFGTLAATPALDDVLQCALLADGNNVAHVLSATVLLLPELGGGRGPNRGNMLSGTAYY
jgi:hypothetical protein